MDYTDLNEACLKDSFLLPRIDEIVDASVEHGMLSFLDAFVCLFMYRLNHSILMSLVESSNSSIVDQN